MDSTDAAMRRPMSCSDSISPYKMPLRKERRAPRDHESGQSRGYAADATLCQNRHMEERDLDLEQLYERLQRLAFRLGSRRWRVVTEAVDHAYDRVVDCLMRGSRGESVRTPSGLAYVILRDLLRRGPDATEMQASRVRALSVIEPSSASVLRRSVPAAVDARDLIGHELSGLRPAEAQAVLASFDATTVREAADLAGMSRRDYRVRIRRASAKIRAHLIRSL